MDKNYNKKGLGYWGIVIIGCGLFITISILSYQFYHWLTIGEWLKIPLYKPLEYLGISFVGLLELDWAGLQKFIFWIISV